MSNDDRNIAILAGRGQSLSRYEFNDDDVVYAISSAVEVIENVRGMITVDRADHFPDAIVENPAIEKHIAAYRSFAFFGGVDITGKPWLDDWADHRCQSVHPWEYTHRGWSPFGQPFTQGPILNSLLFAVQVIDALGFDEVHFVGVDCNDQAYASVVDMLESWQHLACARWINASGKDSRLSQFLEPQYEPVLM